MTAVATLTGRKVHAADDNGRPVCGATSMYHMVPTNRPVDCAACHKHNAHLSSGAQ